MQSQILHSSRVHKMFASAKAGGYLGLNSVWCASMRTFTNTAADFDLFFEDAVKILYGSFKFDCELVRSHFTKVSC